MISLPPLPWGESDLAPHISQETISFHYGKHHKAYVDNANKMIEGTDLANAALEDIVKAAWRQARQEGSVQQRRPGLEPHVLLEQPRARRAAASRPAGSCR